MKGQRNNVSTFEQNDGSSCFLEPRSAGLPTPFRQGSFKLNKLRFSSVDLYGRDTEISQLIQPYRKVQSTKKKEVVMISGYTGTGKSSIVKKLLLETRKDSRKGKTVFFCGGKFDLNRRNEPYVAITSAFTQLVAAVSSIKKKDPELFASIRDSVVEGVGSEGGVLVSVIPNLRELLGEERINMREETSKNRFKFILRQFVHAICKHTDAMVLFLDDLQWADSASLQLINALVTDPELSSFFLVGCFRDNEVEASHPLSRVLDDFEKLSDCQITNIHVGNLDVDTVSSLLLDLLDSRDEKKTFELATIVHEKTLGNIFFVVQYLTSLQDNKLLAYNLGTMSWKWDNEEIRASTKVADNVVELLQKKLKKQLRRQVVELLQIASFLGGTFDKSTLVLVADNMDRLDSFWESDASFEINEKGSTSSVDECLIAGVKEGILEVTESDGVSPSTFHFCHDQIQLAASQCVPVDRKSVFRLRIGEVLVQNLPEPELDSMVFVVVDLLNQGSHLMSDDQKVEAARLNLHAGKKAILASAFTSSSSYLTTGIRLLGADKWENHYSLCLDMFTTAMKAEYCSGDFDQVFLYADEVIKLKDKPISDKLGAYFSLAGCLGDQGRPVEALDMCREVLAQLGVRFPRHFGKAYITWEWAKIKRLLKKRPLTTWTELPTMKDKVKLRAMQMMARCGAFANAAQADLIYLLVFKMMKWSIRYGMSKYSPPAFSGYAWVTVQSFGDIQEAHEVGKFALDLSDRLKAKKTQSFTITIFNMSVSHWVTPLQITRKNFLKGYQAGMQTGDIHDAMMSVFHFCYVCYITGEPLTRLEADLKTYAQQMKEYGQGLVRHLAVVVWQSVLNLMGRSEDPVILTGEAMDQDALLAKSTKSKRLMLRDEIKVHQLQLAYFFGRLDVASTLLDEIRNVAETNPAGMIIFRAALYEGLTAFALARTESNERATWAKRAKATIKKVRGWVRKGNVNCVHILLLLEAEQSVLDGRHADAKTRYDEAIATAGRTGFRSDKALACERVGEYFFDKGDMHWAEHYLTLAHQQYVEWEATAKVDHLHKKYSKLLPASSPEQKETTPTHKTEEARAA